MIAGLTFTPSNYIANCDTMAAWYAANTGYDTDGVVLGDLTSGSLDVRGQSGTEQNPLIIENIRGGPARSHMNRPEKRGMSPFPIFSIRCHRARSPSSSR